MFGYPETYGYNDNGHCGHCNSNPGCHAPNDWGVFCLACCRWVVYTGPKQLWGDGMAVSF